MLLSTSSFIRQGLRGSERIWAPTEHYCLLTGPLPPQHRTGLMLRSLIAKEMLLLENPKSLLIKSGWKLKISPLIGKGIGMESRNMGKISCYQKVREPEMPKAEPWYDIVTMTTQGAPGMGLLGCQKYWWEPPPSKKTFSQPPGTQNTSWWVVGKALGTYSGQWWLEMPPTTSKLKP